MQVEFNKAAQSLTDVAMVAGQKKVALSRLIKLCLIFAADSLSVESLLELLDEENLRKNTAIPSPEWSSDHIALLAQFRCKPRVRR
ncbi:hypothetical protein BHE74_00029350 [Ensete ventricosum]|nr:hypothetical protein GW17_00056621 [Ensete ventricosum]RWW63465.1 hypothetical protein BHE74_00029350 [Ensete ventricosum]RZS02161.1 hypothetical protein BHM03_00032173 [Ensete ventricosum]